MRRDCTPDAEIPVQQIRKTRKYSGPAKGSEAAKERMAKVRAAQWAKNGLVLSSDAPTDAGSAPSARRD